LFLSGLTKPGLLADARRDMEKSALPADSSQHVQELADFFDSQSMVQREPVLCECCGTKMQLRKFDFWFFGTEKKWTIPVPVCPMCGPKNP